MQRNCNAVRKPSFPPCGIAPQTPTYPVPPTAAYKIVKLASGVHSVHSLAHRETFHPVIGPVAEAEALYVKQLHLPERMAAHTGEFIIWDVGLGAAANVLTVLRATRAAACPLRVISFDHTLEPLQFALEHAATLGYFTGYEDIVKTFLRDHQCKFTDGARAVHWQLHLGDFPTFLARQSSPESKTTQFPPSPPPGGGEVAPSGVRQSVAGDKIK